MDLFEAVEKRSSVRQYAPVEIPDADLDNLPDAGRRAPSGKNLQPVRYIAIRAKDTIERLGEVQACVGQASAVIAVVADPDASEFWVKDASAATTQMLLAIHALGYASVWVDGALKRHEAWVKDLLGVPGGLRLVILLPIGKAEVEAPQKPRKPLAELTHRERW